MNNQQIVDRFFELVDENKAYVEYILPDIIRVTEDITYNKLLDGYRVEVSAEGIVLNSYHPQLGNCFVVLHDERESYFMYDMNQDTLAMTFLSRPWEINNFQQDLMHKVRNGFREHGYGEVIHYDTPWLIHFYK